jgi:hypothetical protein
MSSYSEIEDTFREIETALLTHLYCSSCAKLFYQQFSWAFGSKTDLLCVLSAKKHLRLECLVDSKNIFKTTYTRHFFHLKKYIIFTK